MEDEPVLSDLINEVVKELGVHYVGEDRVRRGEPLLFRVNDQTKTAPSDTQQIADTIFTLLATSKIGEVSAAAERAGSAIVE